MQRADAVRFHQYVLSSRLQESEEEVGWVWLRRLNGLIIHTIIARHYAGGHGDSDLDYMFNPDDNTFTLTFIIHE